MNQESVNVYLFETFSSLKIFLNKKLYGLLLDWQCTIGSGIYKTVRSKTENLKFTLKALFRQHTFLVLKREKSCNLRRHKTRNVNISKKVDSVLIKVDR